MKNKFADQEYAAKRNAEREKVMTPRVIARRNLKIKEANQRPESKRLKSVAMKELTSSWQWRAGKSDELRTAWRVDPTHREKVEAGRLRAARQRVARALGGRHRQTDKWEAADALDREGVEPEEITKRLERTAYDENPENAVKALRRGLNRWRKSKE